MQLAADVSSPIEVRQTPALKPAPKEAAQHFVSRAACPVCNSTDLHSICSVPYTASPIGDYLRWYYGPIGPGVEFEYLANVNYTLDECLDCGLIYQRDIPGPTLMSRLYDHWLDPAIVRDLERKERRASHYFWAAHELARVLCYLDRPPSEVNFLDYGMGWGNWCLLAKGFGCNVYGMELSEARTTEGVENGITVLSPTQLGDMRFDFINSEQVFEHLPAPSAQLQTLAKSLKPDGVIRIGVPHAHDVKTRLALWDWTAADDTANSLNAVAPLQHINCYSGRSLATLGAQAGLHEINIPSCHNDVRCATDIARVLIRPLYHRLLPRMAAIRRLQSGTLCFTPG